MLDLRGPKETTGTSISKENQLARCFTGKSKSANMTCKQNFMFVNVNTKMEVRIIQMNIQDLVQFFHLN